MFFIIQVKTIRLKNMRLNANFKSDFYNQQPSLMRSKSQKLSFGYKIVKVSPEKLQTILKEFEETFQISDKKIVPDFLKDIDIQKVLRPLNGIPPAFNQKSKPLVEWQPQMDLQDANRWSLNSVFRQDFYHGTSKEHLEKIQKNGFNPNLSSELECGGGIYVTPNINEAKEYGDGTIATMKINVANPLIIDTPNIIEFNKLRTKFSETIETFSKERNYSNEEKQALFNEQLRRFFTRHGFDMIKNQTYNHYIVLNPKDIALLKN